MKDIQKELLFPKTEYRRRLSNLKEQMAEHDIEVLVCADRENIFYLSGYQTLGDNYQMLIVPIDGEPTLVLRYLESMLAARHACVDDVEKWDDIDDPVEVTVKGMKKRNLLDKVVGIEEQSVYLQVRTWQRLNAAIPNLVDGSGLVERCRAVKSPLEIDAMRRAAKLTVEGMKAAMDTIREGVTENDIAAAAFDAMTRAGSEYLTDDPIITSGDRAGIPHTSYMRRKLQPGDTVLLELSAVYHRYHAPLMRGAVVGEPSPEIEKMAEVCIDALNAALAAVKPGATSGEVDEACRSIITENGFWENFRKRTGYSVGCGLTTWGEGHLVSLKENDPTELVPGMCFHIPPALRLYGRAGMGWSETVTVTDSGMDILTDFPRRLFVC